MNTSGLIFSKDEFTSSELQISPSIISNSLFKNDFLPVLKLSKI